MNILCFNFLDESIPIKTYYSAFAKYTMLSFLDSFKILPNVDYFVKKNQNDFVLKKGLDDIEIAIIFSGSSVFVPPTLEKKLETSNIKNKIRLCLEKSFSDLQSTNMMDLTNVFCEDNKNFLKNYFYQNERNQRSIDVYFKKITNMDIKIDCSNLYKAYTTTQNYCMPTTYIPHFKRNGIKYFNNAKILDYSLFSMFPMPISKVSNDDKKYDVLLMGSDLFYVYPFRDLCKKYANINNGIDGLSILDTTQDYQQYKVNTNKLRDKIKNAKTNKVEQQEINDLELQLENMIDTQYREYLSSIRKARITIVCPSIYGYFLKKYVECMANGSVIVSPYFENAKYVGLENDKNIIFCKPEDVWYEIRNLLADEKKQETIRNNAYELVNEKYCIESFIRYFLFEIYSNVEF